MFKILAIFPETSKNKFLQKINYHETIFHSDRLKGEDRIDNDNATADCDIASDNQNNLSGLC